MPTIITRGAGSAQALGYAAKSTDANFIEDVFSTYLYTGTGASLPIVNGIDLANKGGLVWTKARNSTAFHKWYDSARGIEFAIESNTTDANQSELTGITSFNSNGYTYGTDGNTNNSGTTYCSWTFREQPKFFDVVTYTGTGSNATISHNLGSTPGCIIVKRTDASASWYVYHRGLSGIGNKYIILNSTAAEDTGFFWTPTNTTFNVSSTLGLTANAGTYVAYLFAHDAGGFGLTGTDNVISCGSFTTDGSGYANVTLGYEPQFVFYKISSTSGGWALVDTMRGMTANYGLDNQLFANTSAAEVQNYELAPTATGFTSTPPTGNALFPSQTYIYIAIRRGPMKVPTSGTSVFSPIAYTGTGSARTLTGVGFASDLTIIKPRATFVTNDWTTTTRLASTGSGSDGGNFLKTNSTGPETVPVGYGIVLNTTMDGFYTPNGADLFNNTGDTYILEAFRRAPGFFDVVCYTGTGVTRTVAHNLTVPPELMILKSRSNVVAWPVWSKYGTQRNDYLINLNGAGTYGTAGDLVWGSPGSGVPNMTSTVFSVGDAVTVNNSGWTYVAYLFATVAGVSKVGSYTGTGTTQVINCGFTAGARFVLIKRTDATGDWYVWDSARGIVAGNDPYLWLNSTAAEVTNTDFVDTASSGFEISSTAPAAINANGGSFIFLAIA